MSRKRCCCGGSAPPAYPCQPCPSGEGHEWIVQVITDGIIGDSAGAGVVNDIDYYEPCLAGDCGRRAFTRRGASNTDFSYCPDDLCDSIVDGAGAFDAGDHTIRWSFCNVVNPTDSPGSPYLPDILNDQEGSVTIEWVRPDSAWDFTNCIYLGPGSGGDDCATIIKVVFTYSDTFTYPQWDDAGGGCFSTTRTITMPTQVWTCYYARRVAPGQYFAEGAYYLLRCEYPAPYETVGGSAPFYKCRLLDGVVCSSQHGVSTSPPTTWKPPANITLVRLS